MSGEEITISYDKGGPSSARQARLRQAFGFDCSCSVCSLPLHELHISDARRSQIQRLDDTIGDPFRMRSNPAASLADCHSLLQVLEEEYRGSASALLMRLYYDAFQIAIGHGDKGRAVVFAERAYKARAVCEGDDSPDTRRIKCLMENPAAHASFGACSMRWKTKKKSAPKGVDAVEFERWLWRQSG